MISASPAVRREMDKFERMRVFIQDDKIKDLAKTQMKRMQKEFRTTSIPLHVVLDAQGKELARFVYKGTLSSADDYLAFLREGLAKFK